MAALFSVDELFILDQNIQAARQHQIGDEFLSWNPQHNVSAEKRINNLRSAHKHEFLQRLTANPEMIVDALLIHFHAKKWVLMDLVKGKDSDLITEADTPQNRMYLKQILSGLKTIPSSYGHSAIVRFFRATGKQAKLTKHEGCGILGKEYGWTNNDAAYFLSVFSTEPLSKILIVNDSPDPYSSELKDEDVAYSDRWAITVTDKNSNLFDQMINILINRGLGEAPKTVEKIVKPHKAKQFKVGDKITGSNLRDLPEGSLVKWTYEVIEPTMGNKEFQLETKNFEFVFVSREVGLVKIRPVINGKAYGVRTMQSTKLYQNEYSSERSAEYAGEWAGETLDIEVVAHAMWKDPVSKKDAWKPTSVKKSKFKYIRVEDDSGKYLQSNREYI